MRLNKYQKAWIARLKSGKTRKAIGRLADGKGGNCCLGVGINTCKLEKMKPVGNSDDEDLTDYPKTLAALKLNSPGGAIDYSKLKTWAFFGTLVSINDLTNMSHKEIGEFIDQNREAVFKS